MTISSNYNDLNAMLNSEFENNNSSTMSVIINDNDCSDNFFLELCNLLLEKGIEFQIVKKCNGIDVDGSTVITLDQQYNSGKTTMIFAPYDNARTGYSDSLALSFQSAFNKCGFEINKLYCGKTGYYEDDNGNINRFGPTETEQAIDSLSEVSFVTISLGTDCKDVNTIANVIVDALVRQKYYLDNYDKNSDLIYRASENDSTENVATYFGSNINELKEANNIKDNSFQDSQAVINPHIVRMPVFDKNSEFKLSDSTLKTR